MPTIRSRIRKASRTRRNRRGDSSMDDASGKSLVLLMLQGIDQIDRGVEQQLAWRAG